MRDFYEKCGEQLLLKTRGSSSDLDYGELQIDVWIDHDQGCGVGQRIPSYDTHQVNGELQSTQFRRFKDGQLTVGAMQQ